MRDMERVQAYLYQRMPHLKVIEFAQDTSTAALAAAALGTEVGQIAKSMLFKTKNGDFFMVVAAGNVRMDSKALRDLTGSRVRMANQLGKSVEYQAPGFTGFMLNPRYE